MSSPKVVLATLGGTISMAPPAPGHGAVPTTTAEQMLAAAPELAALADLSVETLLMKPGASLTLDDALGALRWAERAVEHGAAGVVLVQGTDTLEETAYLLDLLWPHENPLVLTGAMRTPSQLSPDGPANLAAAIRTAGADTARGLGAVVVLDQQIHAARRVRKRDSIHLSAFCSGAFGPLGRLHEHHVTIGNRIARPAALARPDRPSSFVPLLQATLGDTGELLRLLIEDGHTDGVVVAGFGAGHVSATFAEAVTAASFPVVLCSRTGDGPVLEATYGFPGSERDLVGRGAIPAGWLGPLKARILLLVLLGAGNGTDAVRNALALHGSMP